MGLILKESPIHGLGIFTDVALDTHIPLFLAIKLDGSITPIARYINHSNDANTYMIHRQNYGWVIFSKHTIMPGSELTIDYRSAPYFVSGPEPHWS